MSIRSYRVYDPDQQQRTQATLYHEGLARARDEQAATLIPRSAEAWGNEQTRLGSWRSGLGAFRPSGVGPMYLPGQGTYTPIGVSSYKEMGRSADATDRAWTARMASASDEERSRWRALR